jgi:hypothetical protein
VVEGFKKVPFSKVVIGDLDVPALISNPTVTGVLSVLERFDDYYTLAGLISETATGSPGDTLSCQEGVASDCCDIPECCIRLENEISGWDGISAVRVACNPHNPDKPGRFFIVCRADNPVTGCRALARCSGILSGIVPAEPEGGNNP